MGQKSLEDVICEIYSSQPKKIKRLSQDALFDLQELIDEDNWFINILTQMHWSQSFNKWDGWVYLKILGKMQELNKNIKNFKPKKDDLFDRQYVNQTLYSCAFEISNWAFPNSELENNTKLLEFWSRIFDFEVFNDSQGEDGYIILKNDIEMKNLSYSLGLPYDKSKKSTVIKKGYKFILEIGSVPICKSFNYITNPANNHIGYARLPYEITGIKPILFLIAKVDNEYI